MKIALDIDDVLARFYSSFCKKLEVPEVKVDIWDPVDSNWSYQVFADIENDIDFWMSLDTLSTPQSITFDIECYITASPEEVKRKEWLLSKGFPDRPVYHTSDKLALMKILDLDILVDDKPETINMINDHGLIGIQFKPSYMLAEIEDKSRIITHLSEVNKFIK